MARRRVKRVLHCLSCRKSVNEPAEIVLDDGSPYVRFIEEHEGPEHTLKSEARIPDGWAIIEGGQLVGAPEAA